MYYLKTFFGILFSIGGALALLWGVTVAGLNLTFAATAWAGRYGVAMSNAIGLLALMVYLAVVVAIIGTLYAWVSGDEE